jgi:hypothetical protein
LKLRCGEAGGDSSASGGLWRLAVRARAHASSALRAAARVACARSGACAGARTVQGSGLLSARNARRRSARPACARQRAAGSAARRPARPAAPSTPAGGGAKPRQRHSPANARSSRGRRDGRGHAVSTSQPHAPWMWRRTCGSAPRGPPARAACDAVRARHRSVSFR